MSKQLYTSFPSQYKTIDQKTPKWFKKCTDAALTYINIDYHGIRTSYQQKVRNLNIMNDIMDHSNVRKQLTPLHADSNEYNVNLTHYPKITQKIDTLIGEDLNRKFNFTAKVINDDAISQKEENINKEVNKFLQDLATKQDLSKEELEKVIKEKQHYFKYNYQDKRERMANQILRYYYRYLDMKEIFNRGLGDLLTVAEETYRVDILGGEPIIYKVDPLILTVIGGNNSPWLEDAEIIIEDDYWSVSSIIDAYYDELTETQVKKIENHLGLGSGSKTGQSKMGIDSQPEYIIVNEMLDEQGTSLSNINNKPQGSFNENGDIRVSRVCWKSRKKVAVVTTIDELSGELKQDIHHEKYELNKEAGDISVYYMWINEPLETTRIGNEEDDIYLKRQRIPVESRRIDNISKCSLGYVGVFFNINRNRALSLVDRLYNFQEAYNLYMNKLQHLFVKYKGPIYKMDFSTIPDDYSVEEWLWYADQLGWELSDPFNEGQKGAAQGKLAGLMNQNQGVKEANMYNIIQQTIDMLNFIESQIDSISGITDSREGNIHQQATVTNTTRELNASANITQKWVTLHDQVKRKALSLFLETAKISFRDGNKKLEHILDDGARELINIDGEMLNEAQYDVQVMDSTEIQQLFNDLKQLSHAMLQNNKITVSQIIDIYSTNSIADTKNKLEQGERELIEREQQAQVQQKELAEYQRETLLIQQNAQNDFELLKQSNELQAELLLKKFEINSKEDISDKDRKLQKELQIEINKLEEMKIKAIGKRNTTTKS